MPGLQVRLWPRGSTTARTEESAQTRRQLTGSVNFCFDENIHTSDAVELYLSFLVLPPVVHSCKIFAMRAVFFVACEERCPVRAL